MNASSSSSSISLSLSLSLSSRQINTGKLRCKEFHHNTLTQHPHPYDLTPRHPLLRRPWFSSSSSLCNSSLSLSLSLSLQVLVSHLWFCFWVHVCRSRFGFVFVCTIMFHNTSIFIDHIDLFITLRLVWLKYQWCLFSKNTNALFDNICCLLVCLRLLVVVNFFKHDQRLSGFFFFFFFFFFFCISGFISGFMFGGVIVYVKALL